jgi:hypothetical protein
MGTFGRIEIAVPRAIPHGAKGKTTEWKSTALHAYQRRTKHAGSLIAGAPLAGTNTRPVQRALSAVLAARSATFYNDFGDRASVLRHSLSALLLSERAKRIRIACYGAAARGATLVNYHHLGAG